MTTAWPTIAWAAEAASEPGTPDTGAQTAGSADGRLLMSISFTVVTSCLLSSRLVRCVATYRVVPSCRSVCPPIGADDAPAARRVSRLFLVVGGPQTNY